MKKKVLFSGILLAFQVLLGHAQQRLLGGDISLLPSYEAAGTVYRNAVGEPVAPLDFFKEQGWNAVRVRLFVEPSKASAEHKGEGVCQDLDYVTKFGQRIKDMGYQFMLDFIIPIHGLTRGNSSYRTVGWMPKRPHCLTVCTDTLKTPFGLWWRPVHVPI